MSGYYTEGHGWIDVDGGIATIGITDFAQYLLGEIALISLPRQGAMLRKGGDAAVVDAMEAASDIYAPIDGVVTDCNVAIENNPTLVNLDPEGRGWFFRMTLSDFSQFEGFMDAQAYRSFCGHI